MNEYNMLNIIKSIAGNSYIGDDCAYIKDLGIVVTQDSLVEDVHFKREWYTPYQLGYKSIAVNISDILASGAKPEYVTIALSLPVNISENFIKEFYLGAKSALYGSKIVGGDITGSKDKIFISITAIGTSKGRYISSRSNAKPGYIIVTKGKHGASAVGLQQLLEGNLNNDIKPHIMPVLEFEFSQSISSIITEPYAMMDTSDGIADALFKIAEASNVKITVDYNKIPKSAIASKTQVLFGGEDYKLIAAIPQKYVSKITNAVIIGEVSEYNGIRLDVSGNKYKHYNELSVYNHFC